MVSKQLVHVVWIISFLIFLIVEKRRKDNIVTFDIRMLVPKTTSLMNKSAENAECFPKSLAFPIQKGFSQYKNTNIANFVLVMSSERNLTSEVCKLQM